MSEQFSILIDIFPIFLKQADPGANGDMPTTAEHLKEVFDRIGIDFKHYEE